jgi:hypothetical protein
MKILIREGSWVVQGYNLLGRSSSARSLLEKEMENFLLNKATFVKETQFHYMPVCKNKEWTAALQWSAYVSQLCSLLFCIFHWSDVYSLHIQTRCWEGNHTIYMTTSS